MCLKKEIRLGFVVVNRSENNGEFGNGILGGSGRSHEFPAFTKAAAEMGNEWIYQSVGIVEWLICIEGSSFSQYLESTPPS